MIHPEDIEQVADSIIMDCVGQGFFHLYEENNLVCMRIDSLRNIIQALVKAKCYERMHDTAESKDAMCNLEILLWELKNEKKNNNDEE